jgi:hypothetical protein
LESSEAPATVCKRTSRSSCSSWEFSELSQ